MKNDDSLTKLFLYSTNTSWSGNSMSLTFYYNGGGFTAPYPSQLPINPVLMDTLVLDEFNQPLSMTFEADGVNTDTVDGYAYFDITKDSETGEIVDQFCVFATGEMSDSNFLVEEGTKYYVNCHAPVTGETIAVLMASPSNGISAFYYRFYLRGSSFPEGYKIPFKTVQYDENRNIIYESIDSEAAISSGSNVVSSKLTTWVTNAKYATVFPVSKGFIEGYKLYGLSERNSYHITRQVEKTYQIRMGNFSSSQYGSYYFTYGNPYPTGTTIEAGGLLVNSNITITKSISESNYNRAIYLYISGGSSKVKVRYGYGSFLSSYVTCNINSSVIVVNGITSSMLDNNFYIQTAPV